MINCQYILLYILFLGLELKVPVEAGLEGFKVVYGGKDRCDKMEQSLEIKGINMPLFDVYLI